MPIRIAPRSASTSTERTYSGALKSFLDLLPQFALGKPVLPLLTGGTIARVLALDYALRPVLQSLDPRLIVAGLGPRRPPSLRALGRATFPHDMPAPSLPTLQSNLVQLRMLAAGDCDAFIAGVARSRELHAAWVSPPVDRAGYATYLERTSASYVPLGVFSREDGGLVGVFNFGHIALGFFCSAYLGYFAFAPYERRGLMGEGLALALQMAFEQLQLHRIEANIQPDNAESIALVRRAGFEREGFSPGYLFIAGAWRDHERWAMRKEVWSARGNAVRSPATDSQQGKRA